MTDDQSASTGSLIEAAAEERAALRSALLEEISAAYLPNGVTKAVTNPTDGEELTVYAGK